MTAAGHLEDQPLGTPPRMRPPQLAHGCLHLSRDLPGMMINPVTAVCQPRRPLVAVTAQPRMHALTADPVTASHLGHRNPGRTSSTARYLCSVTLSSLSMSGSVKHQTRPRCKESSGTPHRVNRIPVTTFSTVSR